MGRQVGHRPEAFEVLGGMDAKEVVGVNVRGAEDGAVMNAGFGERIVPSLLGDALNEGVAETLLLLYYSV